MQITQPREESEVVDVEPARPPVLTHCIVDLWSTRDCLLTLLPYAAHGLLTVCAYAGIAFRGYGVSPGGSVGGSVGIVAVYQADTPDKTAQKFK